jgi:hypothetical protein
MAGASVNLANREDLRVPVTIFFIISVLENY